MGHPRFSGTVCGDNWSPPSGWMGAQAMGGEQLHHLKKNVIDITAPTLDRERMERDHIGARVRHRA